MVKFAYLRYLTPLAFAVTFFIIMPPSSSAGNSSTLDAIKARGVLLWGSDSEGGAPYVFPDPKDPSKLVGFELDIAEAIAIVATTPRNGDIGVMPNAVLSLTFSEPVDQQTISFLLSTGSTTIPCTMSYSGTAAMFTPLNVLASTTSYTATVSAGLKDLAGNMMLNDHIWSFVTGTAVDTTLPIVTATTPAIGATSVAMNTVPSVTFSEPVVPTTITFTLTGGGATIPCTMSYSGVTASYKPSSNLKKNTLYTARVSAGVRDLAGNAMPNDYPWSFTTSKN